MKITRHLKIHLINLVYYNKAINRFKGNFFQLTRRLTTAELQVMEALWTCKSAPAKQILSALPEPKPSPATFSFLVQSLEKKGFLEIRGAWNQQQLCATPGSAAYYNSSTNRRFYNNWRRMLGRLFITGKDVDIKKLEQLLAQLKEKHKDA